MPLFCQQSIYFTFFHSISFIVQNYLHSRPFLLLSSIFTHPSAIPFPFISHSLSLFAPIACLLYTSLFFPIISCLSSMILFCPSSLLVNFYSPSFRFLSPCKLILTVALPTPFFLPFPLLLLFISIYFLPIYFYLSIYLYS